MSLEFLSQRANCLYNLVVRTALAELAVIHRVYVLPIEGPSKWSVVEQLLQTVIQHKIHRRRWSCIGCREYCICTEFFVLWLNCCMYNLIAWAINLLFFPPSSVDARLRRYQATRPLTLSFRMVIMLLPLMPHLIMTRYCCYDDAVKS